MTYCTFGSVTEILINGVKDDRYLPQLEVVILLFESFYNSDANYSFDNASVNRWIKGTTPVTQVLKQYYFKKDNRKNTASDIEKNLLPVIVDIDVTVCNIYDLVMNDTSISEEKRQELTAGYPFEDDKEKCGFIGGVVYFTLERKQTARNNLPVLPVSIHDRVIGAEVPAPCRYFCGRYRIIRIS